MAVYAITLSVARAGVFFGRANVFAPESAMLKLKGEEKMGGGGESQREWVIKSKMAATTIRT